VALSYDSAYMIVSSPSSILKNGFLLPTTTGFLLWWAKSHVQIVVCPTQQATAGPLGRPTESKRAGRDSAPPGAPCGDVANPGDSFLPGGRGRRLLSGRWFGDETYMKDYTQYIVMVGKCIWDVDFYAQFAFFLEGFVWEKVNHWTHWTHKTQAKNYIISLRWKKYQRSNWVSKCIMNSWCIKRHQVIIKIEGSCKTTTMLWISFLLWTLPDFAPLHLHGMVAPRPGLALDMV
jgi:hypothetical protein